MKIFLETENLLLKITELSDFDNILALRTDPDVMRYLHNGVRNEQQVREEIARSIAEYQKYGFSSFCVFEKESGEFVGRAGLFYFAHDDTRPELEIGYALHKKYWGKGYATELARALIAWARKNLPQKRLLGSVWPDNEASRCVLLKVGMQYIGLGTRTDRTVELYEYFDEPSSAIADNN